MTTIYEVNLEVDPDIRDEFSDWLPGHVERVLKKPGFLDAVIEVEELPTDRSPVFCVRYRLKNRAALEKYFRNHATAMRQEGIDRFGDHFRATRRILAVQPSGPGSWKTQIRSISPEQTHALRQSVLRPQQPPDEMIYPGDDDATTLHLGAFCKGELIGIASVYRQPPPGKDDDRAWRLRGIAVRPDKQRHGLGGRLMGACLAYVSDSGGTTLWCNARTSAASFYRELGFRSVGDEFEIEGIGPHFLMQLAFPDNH